MVRKLIKDYRGSMSLFLACSIVMVCILGSTAVSLAGLRQTEHQLVELGKQQADTILAAYERELFERYGLLAYGEQSPDRIGPVIPLYKVNGQTNMEMSSCEDITDGPGLKMQIQEFMQKRTVIDLGERLKEIELVLKEAMDDGYTAMLKDDNLKNLAGEFGMYLEPCQTLLKEGSSGESPSEETSEEIIDEPAKWSDDDARLAADALAHFKEAAQMQFAYSGEGSGGTLLDLNALGEQVNKLERFFNFGEIPLYDDLGINVYGQRMFKNQTAGKTNSQERRFAENLRGISFSSLKTKRNYESEYLLFGQTDDGTNKDYMDGLLFGMRFMIQLLDYRASETKMDEARTIGSVLSGVIAAVTLGEVSIEPETLANLVWLAESAYGAYTDLDDLRQGKTVDLLPYSESQTIEVYYEDHLLFFSLFVAQDTLLKRMGLLLEENFGQALCLAIEVKLYWQGGPDGSLQRNIVVQAGYDEFAKQDSSDY